MTALDPFYALGGTRRRVLSFTTASEDTPCAFPLSCTDVVSSIGRQRIVIFLTNT